MILRSWLAFFLLVVMIVTSRDALAQKRFALLIGNQDYEAQVGRLKNPINDVKLLSAALRGIGFSQNEIHVVQNGTRRDILGALDRYAEMLQQAGTGAIGFFYYSGHGVASKRDRRNYLIPVEVERLDRNVWYDAIALDQVVSTLSDRASNAAHFVVFDACRNLLNMPTKGGKGFVPVSAKKGMLIAFSTDPGETATDEGSGSGPYAAALATELVKPGLDHLDVFQNVKEAVYKMTKVQVPWERNGLHERIYLAGRNKTSGNVTTPQSQWSEVARAWAATKDTTSVAVLETFANRYRGTVYEALARARADELRQRRDSKSAALVSRPKSRRPAPPVAAAAMCAERAGVRACTSSVLATKGINKSHYGPRNLADGDAATAWVEGGKGDGRGEWIVLSWPSERRLTGFRIANGYGKSARLFKSNGRPHRLHLKFSSGETAELALADSAKERIYRLPHSIYANWVRIEIREIRPGSRYRDTAISELQPVFE